VDCLVENLNFFFCHYIKYTLTYRAPRYPPAPGARCPTSTTGAAYRGSRYPGMLPGGVVAPRWCAGPTVDHGTEGARGLPWITVLGRRIKRPPPVERGSGHLSTMDPILRPNPHSDHTGSPGARRLESACSCGRRLDMADCAGCCELQHARPSGRRGWRIQHHQSGSPRTRRNHSKPSIDLL